MMEKFRGSKFFIVGQLIFFFTEIFTDLLVLALLAIRINSFYNIAIERVGTGCGSDKASTAPTAPIKAMAVRNIGISP